MGYLHIHNIGKAYKRYPKKWGRMAEWMGMKAQHELRWVLRDISFDVEPGESVGIIGINGAGKSTLLKIITGTTRPSTGYVETGGHISALLELGMGFHPEFTGRQNACLSAQLHGMTAKELEDKIKDIESFAEIGDYFDQPVRTYSTGMQVRVAFSVATCMRPEILIVDEALSVGDAAFQRKCFRRIEDFRSDGTTLLFVSHSTETVKSLCDNAILLRNGRIAAIGQSKNVCDEYERILFGGKAENHQKTASCDSKPNAMFDQGLLADCELSYGNGQTFIENVWLSDEDGNTANIIPACMDFSINYIVRFNQATVDPIFAMMIKTKEGIAIYGTDTIYLNCKNTGVYDPGEKRLISFKIKNNLAPGVYYLNCGIRDDSGEKTEFLHRRVDVLIFRITPSSITTIGVGVVELSSSILIESCSDAAMTSRFRKDRH